MHLPRPRRHVGGWQVLEDSDDDVGDMGSDVDEPLQAVGGGGGAGAATAELPTIAAAREAPEAPSDGAGGGTIGGGGPGAVQWEGQAGAAKGGQGPRFGGVMDDEGDGDGKRDKKGGRSDKKSKRQARRKGKGGAREHPRGALVTANGKALLPGHRDVLLFMLPLLLLQVGGRGGVPASPMYACDAIT